MDFGYSLEAFDRLRMAGVSLVEVEYVLRYSRPRERHHLDSVTLYLTARDRAGRWLCVGLIEASDERYEVVGAAYVTEDRAARLDGLLQEWRRRHGDTSGEG